MPSYTEIMELLGFKSKNAVFKLVQKLIDDEVVEKDSQGRLSPKNIYGSLAVLGVVEAGIPMHAEEEVLDRMSLDEFLVDNKEATYMLEVKGESMIDAGIHEGDYVLVERTSSAKLGDIVIAEVDGGWTMKYYRRDKAGRIYLEPANESFKNIYPASSLNIVAKVKAVVRKY